MSSVNACELDADLLLSIQSSYIEEALYFVDLRSQKTLWLDLCENHENCKCILQISQFIRNKSIIQFNSPWWVSPVALFRSLLSLSHLLISAKIAVTFFVSNTSTLPNALASSFFKTLAAEKFPLIQCVHNERLSVVHVPTRYHSLQVGENWLITGGLSGIGFATAKWLVNDCKVRNLVLISRRSPSRDLFAKLKELRKISNVIVISSSVTDYETLAKWFGEFTFKINGMIHGAGVLRDAAVERQNVKMFEEVLIPKGDGFHVLQKLLMEYGHRLDHLIVMSSITAVLGNAGQLNYSVANAYLDHQISALRINGYVGTTIHWGNWLEVGMAAKAQNKLRALGFVGLTTKEALAFMAYAIKHKPVELIAAKINWTKLLKKRLDIDRSVAPASEKDNISTILSDLRSQASLLLSADTVERARATSTTNYGSASPEAPLEVCTCGLCHNNSNCDTKTTLEQEEISRNHVNLVNGYKDERTPGKLGTGLLTALSPLSTSTSACDLLGLNLFFSDEADFKRTLSESIAYLTNTFNTRLTFSSDKPCASHVTGASLAEVLRKLNTLKFKPLKRNLSGKSVMIFSGEDAQYTGMGMQLSDSFPVFKDHFEKCLEMAEKHLRKGISLLDIVRKPAKVELLHQTQYAQPIMFAYGFACAMLWKEIGFQPDFYLGHSVGEIVGGVVSGILTLEDGIRLVVERAVALEALASRGALLSLDSSAKTEVLAKFDVSVAALNSLKQVEIVGEYAKLKAVLRLLNANNMQGRITNANYPLHSSLIDEQDLRLLRATLENVHFKRARVPLVSSLSGSKILTFSSDYLIEHALSTVNIVACIRTLAFLNVTTWVEAGPSNAISIFVRDTLERKQMARHAILQTASGGSRDAECFLSTALELEKRGVPVKWPSIYESGVSTCPSREVVTAFPIHFRGASSEIDRNVLRNHRVCEENIIPGAYQFYILLTWINAKSEPGTYFTLVNARLSAPWKCEEGYEYDLYQTNKNTVHLVVNGITRCSSSIVFHNEPLAPCLDIDDFQKECTRECDMKRFYDGMAVSGLDYRDQFRAISCLKRSESRTYSLLDYKKPQALWTLIDAAMHAVCVSVVDRRPDVYFLPIHIGEIYMCPNFDVNPSQSIIAVTDKVVENDKFIQAHACIYVNSQLLFQYKNKFSLVLKKDPSSASNMATLDEKTATLSAAGTTVYPPENVVALDKDKSIFVLSYDGCFCSSALDTSEFWQQIKAGIEERTCTVREFSSTGDIFMDIDVAGWDPEFFGITPKEAQHIDVTQRLMMQSVWRCLEKAKTRTIPKNTGVFIGLSSNDFTNRVYDEVKEDVAGYYSSGTNGSCVAGRIAHWLKLEGPALVVDTACSSSFTALINAVDALINKRCDYAIVGGINIILHDTVTEVLKNAGMLSAKGICQVFDAGADGYVRSEAVGCVLLSRYGTDSLFRVSRWAMGHNGDSAALQVPNGSSQEKVMRQIYERNVLDVECHGTGTSLGDPIEAQAVSKVYGHVTVSSIKAQAGHAEAASGMASLMSSILQMKHSYRSHQPHFKCPNPKIDCQLLQVNSVGEDRLLSVFAINNFGFSGTNCSILIEKLPEQQTSYKESNKYHLAPVSARDDETLCKVVNDLKDFVSTSDKDIGHICSSLQKSRAIYKCRYSILYNNKRQIVWEYGHPSNISDTVPYPKDIDSFSFEYGRGFCLYLTHFNKNPRDFCAILSDQNSSQKDPALATGVQFHVLLGIKFVQGQSVLWASYNVEQVNRDIELPAYPFKQEHYWPFKQQFASNFGVSRGLHKNIYFEKILVEVPRGEREAGATVINFGRKVNLPNIKYNSVSAMKCCRSVSQNSILLYHPYSSTTHEALKLVELWQTLEGLRNFVLLVAFHSNGTSCTEWTALLRTLASERSLPYKFVSYSSTEQLEVELSTNDIFECIFHRGSRRYVERLNPVKTRRVGIPSPKHLLITGGSGGIGRRILTLMNPLKATIVTKSNNYLSVGTHIKPHIDTALIKTDVTCLKLPAHEYYDTVVHCAGVVDNALMSAMDHDRFASVCLPKVKGLRTLQKQLVGRNPQKMIVASSVACILGSRGQANYAFANGLMTSTAERLDTPTQVIHWGPWKNTGLLRNSQSEKINCQLKAGGWNLLKPVHALDVLSTDAKNVLVFSGDFQRIVRSQNHLHKFLSRIVHLEETSVESPDFTVSSVYQKQSSEYRAQLSIEAIIRDVSGIDDIQNHRSTPLMTLGIDSLMIEDIRIRINEKLSLKLTSAEIYDNCTLESLSKLVGGHTRSVEKPMQGDLRPNSTEQSVEIAIIGSSGAFSGCDSIDDFWRNILAGKECIRKTKPRDEGFVDAAGLISDVDKFDYKFWNLTQEDASLLDPQLRVFLQTAYHALEKSGYIRQRTRLRVGVFAGAEPNEYGDPNAEAEGSLRRLFAMNMKDFVSTFTAHMLNLRGPAVGVYSACSTALLAITQACNSLRLSSIDLAIAGGISLVFPSQTRYVFQEGLVLSQTGTCRPFDKNADGTVRGSAVGCVVLKRLDHALRDNDHIEAVIRSYGMSNDGLHKASFMAPNCEGQYECMREALGSLTVDEINKIGYLECHGTGTRVGDEIEIDAIKRAYKDCSNLTIGSVKANIGHGFAGSGMAGLFKTMKILQNHTVPPQINISDLRPDIPYNVNMKTVPLRAESMAAVSAFGIGGTNVHLVLKQSPPRPPELKEPQTVCILPVSGATSTACTANCRAIAEYMTAHPEVDLDSVASTLQCRREHYTYRVAIVASSVRDAISQLMSATTPVRSTNIDNSNICFFFAPQGVQYPNMENASLNQARVFAEELRRMTATASKLFQKDFMDIMYPKDSKSDEIFEANYAQVAVFIICKAILAQLDRWGIFSNLLLGHSVGEYTAASYAGIIDEYSCMELLKRRGELVSKTRRARMLAVNKRDMPCPEDTEVSAILSENLKCFVGSPDTIEKLVRKLSEEEITFKELATKYGFHTSMMDAIKEQFLSLLETVHFTQGRKNIVSNVDGEIINTLTNDYCWSHMRSPVDLRKCLDTVLSNRDVRVIIEIGPSGVLKHLLAERRSDVRVISTVLGRRRGAEQGDHSQLIHSVADLWTCGFDIDFAKAFDCSRFDPLLPQYSFERTTCWRRRLERSRTQYYTASWRPRTRINHEREHFHNSDVLVISREHTKFLDLNCKSCSVRTIKPCDLLSESFDEFVDFSLIVYVPDENITDLAQPMLISRKICSAIATLKTRFIVISLTGEAVHWTAIGPIREHHLGKERKNFFVDNSEGLPLATVVHFASKLNEEVVLATKNFLFSIIYAEAEPSDNGCRLGKTVAIIGGTGAIGSAYVNVLRKKPGIVNIAVLSRTPSAMACAPGVSFFKMDVCDSDCVERTMNELYARYGGVDTIVHAAGRATSKSLNKSVPEMLDVFLPKVAGVTNVLEYLRSKSKHVENLVMASSLSSVIALQGTEDYAAANIFLDALALNGHPNVGRILSVQWPAWRGVGMASAYGADELQSMLMRTALLPQDGERAVRETLGFSGVLALSPLSPLEMRKEVEKAQLTAERVEIPVNIEEKKTLKDKVACIWSDVLGTSVSDDSDFFSMGGNSLSALRVVWSLTTMLKISTTVDLLFKNPLFKEFVKALPCASSTEEKAETFDRTSPAELTYSQENMFLLRHLERGTQYNIMFAVYLRRTAATFSRETLVLSIHTLIARQHSLRTCFCRESDASTTRQVVLSLTECFQNLSCEETEPQKHAEIVEQEGQHEFILKDVPLRLRMNKINDDYIVLFNQHHIITDGWSVTVLAQELKDAYTMYLNSKEGRAEPIPFSVSQYAHWQRKHVEFSSAIEELKDLLAGREATTLPQKSAEENLTPGKAKFRKLIQMLPDTVVQCIKKLAKTHHTTEFVISLSAFVMSLRKLKVNNQDDSIVLGCPVLGRNEKVRDLIGYFLNNMVISLDVHVEDIFQKVISAVKKVTSEMRKFENVPFHMLVAKLNPIRQASEHPLFQIFFNYRQELDFPNIVLADAHVKINQLSMNTIFNLSVSFDETTKGTRIMIEYNSSRYRIETMRLLMDTLLRSFIERKRPQLKEVGSCVDYPLCVLPKCYDFARGMQSTSVIRPYSSVTLSYEEMHTKITNLAENLSDSYVKLIGSPARTDDIVGVEVNFRDAVEVFMALHQIGVAYAPIDTAWPAVRKEDIVKNISSAFVVTEDSLNVAPRLSKTRKRMRMNKLAAEDVAYVIHTSGTTGTPKGVLISHENLSSFLRGATRQTLMRPGYRVSHSVNVVFDVSALNLFGSTVNGCELCIHEDFRYSPFEVAEMQCDFVFLTSATFNALTVEDLQKMTSLEKLFVGGETVNDRKLKAALDLGLDVTQIYGPTECTVWSLTNRCKILHNEGALIGKPVPNESCFTKYGAYEAELILKGSKVARGYIGDVEKKQFYIDNGDPCYATGDIVRREKEGMIYRGRIDRQIKLRGHRIETEEVERAILSSSPEVMEVSVLPLKNSLVAFVVARKSLHEDDLNTRLKAILPLFMMPSRFVRVSSIPLNSSGKVDKNMLLKEYNRIGNIRSDQSSFRLSKTSSVEDRLISIVRRLLEVLEVKTSDSFFSLGGHSLLLFELKKEIENEFAVDIEVYELFSDITLGEMARIIANKMQAAVLDTDTSIIIRLRETNQGRINVYLIHAVGGSVFPYHAFIHVLPREINVFAIEYRLDFEAKSLKELAAFYAKAPRKSLLKVPLAVDCGLCLIGNATFCHTISKMARRSPNNT
ncbi:Beta-ketoacyl synthase protein [Oesophagostomum dentatum]|uniref:Beta-ketoacyl synthase protein n=1 Tax=Oesophagostomum dentatum TaxID=61180 RepID=A0A0B1TUM2_OESDE|nr:Beta-ketoacyl synthase protein [Oesophagostomum dentatum]